MTEKFKTFYEAMAKAPEDQKIFPAWEDEDEEEWYWTFGNDSNAISPNDPLLPDECEGQIGEYICSCLQDFVPDFEVTEENAEVAANWFMPWTVKALGLWVSKADIDDYVSKTAPELQEALDDDAKNNAMECLERIDSFYELSDKREKWNDNNDLVFKDDLTKVFNAMLLFAPEFFEDYTNKTGNGEKEEEFQKLSGREVASFLWEYCRWMFPEFESWAKRQRIYNINGNVKLKNTMPEIVIGRRN